MLIGEVAPQGRAERREPGLMLLALVPRLARRIDETKFADGEERLLRIALRTCGARQERRRQDARGEPRRRCGTMVHMQ